MVTTMPDDGNGEQKFERRFVELASGEIGKNKYLVISRRTDGKYSVAQRAVTEFDDRSISMFIKNAIVVDQEGLETVSNIITEALKQVRGGKK